MRGDVWVKWNKKGERVLCIDNGKTITEKVIGKVSIKEEDNYTIPGCATPGKSAKKLKKSLTRMVLFRIF